MGMIQELSTCASGNVVDMAVGVTFGGALARSWRPGRRWIMPVIGVLTGGVDLTTSPSQPPLRRRPPFFRVVDFRSSPIFMAIKIANSSSQPAASTAAPEMPPWRDFVFRQPLGCPGGSLSPKTAAVSLACRGRTAISPPKAWQSDRHGCDCRAVVLPGARATGRKWLLCSQRFW